MLPHTTKSPPAEAPELLAPGRRDLPRPIRLRPVSPQARKPPVPRTRRPDLFAASAARGWLAVPPSSRPARSPPGRNASWLAGKARWSRQKAPRAPPPATRNGAASSRAPAEVRERFRAPGFSSASPLALIEQPAQLVQFFPAGSPAF